MVVDKRNYGSVGEALAVGAAGATLGYGTARVAGAGENLRAIAALSGGLNGTIGGARGTYDWGSGSGELAFLTDSTWGLGSTTLGNVFVGLNELSGADYVSGWSHRQNRQIYQGPNSFTPSGYGMTHGNASAGVDHNDLHHETTHMWQARLFGPFYLSGTVGTWVGGTMALLVRPGTNPSFETAAYYNSPFEAQAYQAEGKYPPSTWNSAQKELMWW